MKMSNINNRLFSKIYSLFERVGTYRKVGHYEYGTEPNEWFFIVCSGKRTRSYCRLIVHSIINRLRRLEFHTNYRTRGVASVNLSVGQNRHSPALAGKNPAFNKLPVTFG